MENVTTNHIGEVLKFNQADYESALRKYRLEVGPAIQKVKKEYKALPSAEEFTDSVFKDMIKYGIKNIQAKHEDMIRKDLKGFKTSYVLDMALAKIDSEVEPLKKAIEALHTAVYNACNGSYTHRYNISLDFVSIENEEPVYNADEIRKDYEIRVENEEQSTLYDLMLKVKEAHDNLRTFLVANDVDLHRFTIIGDQNSRSALMYEFNNGELSFEPTSIGVIETSRRFKQYANRA